MAYEKEQRDALVTDALHMMSTIGVSMSFAADQLGLAHSTLCDWLLSDEYVAQYNTSRILRADTHACEINDYKKQMLSGQIQADVARVAIDACKWQAGTMDSPRWGARQHHELTGKNGNPIKTDMTWTIEHVTAEIKKDGN